MIGTVTDTLRLENTIVANNTASLGSDNCYGTIIDGGYNIDSGTTCGLSTTGSMSSTNPLLSLLGNYSGPTKTFGLLLGIPAINAANAFYCPATDQRGIPRPQSTGCDIGAVEGTFYPLYLPLIQK